VRRKIGQRRVTAGRYVATGPAAAPIIALPSSTGCATIGIDLEIISTAEEARLVVAGCAPLLHSRIPLRWSSTSRLDQIVGCAQFAVRNAARAEILGSVSLPFGLDLHRAVRQPEAAGDLPRDGRRGRGCPAAL
jgi:hypothetical protein